MKKLLSLALLLLLTGCVTYYQPETALEDGVYYAEDDPNYVVYQGPYPGFVYYPWVSLDYFYLGIGPYPRYSYFYGFPFGLVYDPYWYSPYPGYSAWGPYYGYCSHDRVCGPWNGYGMSGHGQNRHARNTNGGNRNRNDDEIDNEESRADLLERPKNSASMYGTPYGQYVSTTPSGHSGNRGMVIRSNETKKVGKSRVQPGTVTPSSNGIVIAAPSAQTPVVSGSSTNGGLSASRPPSASMAGSSSMSGNQVRSSPASSSPRSSGPRSSGPSSSSPSSSSPRSSSPRSSGPSSSGPSSSSPSSSGPSSSGPSSSSPRSSGPRSSNSRGSKNSNPRIENHN